MIANDTKHGKMTLTCPACGEQLNPPMPHSCGGAAPVKIDEVEELIVLTDEELAAIFSHQFDPATGEWS